MLVSKILAAKYGPTLIKALFAYFRVEHKELYDLPLKALENRLKDEVATFEKGDIGARLRREVLINLEQLIGAEVDKGTFERAASIAAVTLESIPLYQFLFEYLFNPSVIPQKARDFLDTPIDSSESPIGAMHDRIVYCTAEAFSYHIHDLPGFMRWFVREIRRKLENTEQRLAVLSRFLDHEEAQDAVFEMHYRERLLETTNRVELFIRHDEIQEHDKNLRLDVAYVTLQLAAGRRGSSGQQSVSAEDLLSEAAAPTRRLLILGKAGSGKTTLLRWFALKAAQGEDHHRGNDFKPDASWEARAYDTTSTRWQSRVPFLIRLRDYPGGSFPSVEGFTAGARVVEPTPANWVHRQLKKGAGLVLIDGLDELSIERRRYAMDWIGSLLASYPGGNILLVTSRPEAIAPNALEEQRFTEYEVRDLTADGKVLFIKNWHEAARQRLRNNPHELRKLPAKEASLTKEVRSNPSVDALAASPLLCALLCALNRVSSDRLPDNLRDLCHNAIRMMLRDRDEEQQSIRDLAPAEYRACDISLRLSIARDMAYVIVEKDDSTITKQEAVSEVRRSLGGPSRQSLEYARKVFEGLHHRSNLVRETGLDGVEFSHNDLRDYLAAGKYVDDDLADELVRKVRTLGREKWQPILLFATGDPERRTFRNKVVANLLSGQGGNFRLADEDVVLAMRIADQSQVPLRPELDERLDSIRERLLPLDTEDKVVALAAAGSSAVPYLRIDSSRSANINAECVRNLSRIGTREARSAIDEYFTVNPSGVLRGALADAVGLEAYAEKRNVLELMAVQAKVLTYQDGRDPQMKSVSDLTPLATRVETTELYLSGTSVQDLSPLKRLRYIKTLDLSGTPVRDLSVLKELKDIESLALSRTKVHDISTLSNLTRLRVLKLNRTSVVDLSPLLFLTSLRYVDLHETNVSVEQSAALESKLPRCKLKLP